ncbi:CBS domain-containing protein [Alterisphingorhabdus coralli]|uniref:CBS domain-containing protein n=1 Tax=Alterisphingorhabdus coralli TaxID=3071408 RepID=A0AA97I1W1_9SPHN|nr:CBS domain-containing protein [Parasphingorhabdus sp. SCSIO 66989]WOE75720.1 CBS domain-containing protein [Parasphingorhabdus sp. SCSIO 66989]
MTIATILQQHSEHEVVGCNCTDTVREVVAMLSKNRIGAVPVLRDGKVVGIFSERDLVYRVTDQGDGILDSEVQEAMTSPAVTVTSDTGVLAALSLMTRRRIRHLPVVDADTLIGFVSIGDLVKYRIDKIEREAEALRDYIQHG